MGSAEGGVEIEQVAADHPGGDRHRVHADPLLGLLDYAGPRARLRDRARRPPQGRRGDRQGPRRGRCSRTTPTSSRSTRWRSSASPAPTAPAVERLVCLDAKITLDDSALARHPGLEALRDLDEEDPADVEARARRPHASSSSTATIGCMVNGAGLAMTTMDLVKRAGGEPANFLDIGGGARGGQGRGGDAAHPRRPEGRARSSSTSSAASPAATRSPAA